LRRESSENEVDKYIIRTTKENKPESVKQLVELVQEKYDLPEKEILNRILYLQEKEKLRLKPNQAQIPQKLTAYLTSNHAYWYWITIILASITVVVVFLIPENAFPLVYARYVLGTIFILWLPGYTFIKALFPEKSNFKKSEKSLDTIERVALSLGMSIALVPMVGLLLNYTPWGIQLTPVTLSLLALTLVFATTAIIREYYTKIQLEQTLRNVEHEHNT